MLDKDRERRLHEAGLELQDAQRRKAEAVRKLRAAVQEADGDVSVAEVADIADVSLMAVYAFRPDDE